MWIYQTIPFPPEPRRLSCPVLTRWTFRPEPLPTDGHPSPNPAAPYRRANPRRADFPVPSLPGGRTGPDPARQTPQPAPRPTDPPTRAAPYRRTSPTYPRRPSSPTRPIHGTFPLTFPYLHTILGWVGEMDRGPSLRNDGPQYWRDILPKSNEKIALAPSFGLKPGVDYQRLMPDNDFFDHERNRLLNAYHTKPP